MLIFGRILGKTEKYEHANGDIYDWTKENVSIVKKKYSTCGGRKKYPANYLQKGDGIEEIKSDWQSKVMNCMECGKSFKSTGKAHRHCDTCRDAINRADSGGAIDSDSTYGFVGKKPRERTVNPPLSECRW